MSEPLHGLLHLVRRHPAGTVLFREGDPGGKMFVIRGARYLSLEQRFEYA
ncbi:MAG: hypothetical protein ACJ79H_15855 [Myxococcales bacterium]